MNEEVRTDRVNTIKKKKMNYRLDRTLTTCRYCGRKYKFDKKENCPAYDKAYNDYGKSNLFADCCDYQ